MKDFHGLLDAIANNTLTTGVPGNYDANAFLDRLGKTHKSWITGTCIADLFVGEEMQIVRRIQRIARIETNNLCSIFCLGQVASLGRF